jgi:sulfite reductase alpha subunit-like flavoprotein
MHHTTCPFCRTKVPIWIDKGAFALPPPIVPLICVGPGTGVAPLRSFLHQRAALARAGVTLAPSYLFFGCRNQGKDYLYCEEWPELHKLGVLHRGHGLQCAFSRDHPRKVYVQHKVAECAAWLWPLLAEGSAHVFVSGSAEKMPAAVAAAFEGVVAQGVPCDAVSAERAWARIARCGRYSVEAWS